MKKYELGTVLKDSVTEFAGVATAYIEYLDSDNQYLIQPKGCPEKAEGIWFVEKRLTPIN